MALSYLAIDSAVETGAFGGFEDTPGSKSLANLSTLAFALAPVFITPPTIIIATIGSNGLSFMSSTAFSRALAKSSFPLSIAIFTVGSIRSIVASAISPNHSAISPTNRATTIGSFSSMAWFRTSAVTMGITPNSTN